jgi:hypothetical protein
MYGQENFYRYNYFYASSQYLDEVLAPGKRLKSAAGELIRKQADRQDIPFKSVMEADLLCLLMALITQEVRWYPQTLYYASYGYQFPFFLRATQHKHFKHLVTITGINSVDELKKAAVEGYKRLDIMNWHDFHPNKPFWELLNMEKLNSVQ